MLAKRGIGTVEFVIIALVIGLILLGLYAVFGSKVFGSAFSAESCAGRGGSCDPYPGDCPSAKPVSAATSDCKKENGKQCCVAVGG